MWSPVKGSMWHNLLRLSRLCFTKYNFGIPSNGNVSSWWKASPTQNLSRRNRICSIFSFSSSGKLLYSEPWELPSVSCETSKSCTMPVPISLTLRLSNWTPKDSENHRAISTNERKHLRVLVFFFYFGNHFTFGGNIGYCCLQSFCKIFKFFIWFPRFPIDSLVFSYCLFHFLIHFLFHSFQILILGFPLFNFVSHKLHFYEQLPHWFHLALMYINYLFFHPIHFWLFLLFCFLYNCTTLPANLDKWTLISSFIDWSSVKANRPHGIVYSSRFM